MVEEMAPIPVFRRRRRYSPAAKSSMAVVVEVVMLEDSYMYPDKMG